MKKWLLPWFISLVALAFLSCSDKNPVSLGQEWEIYTIADQEDWQVVGPIITEALEKKLVTPLTEKEYVVTHVDPENLQDYLLMRNLLLISSLRPGSKMDKILRKALPDDAYEKIVSGEEYLFIARNQWAREQFIVILASPGIEALKASVASYPDYIYTLFDQTRNQRLREVLFFRTQGKIEKHLKKNYHWTFKIPYGYKIAREDKEKNFVQLSLLNPDRNIFIHWVDHPEKDKYHETWLLKKINWMGSNYNDAYVKEGYYYATKKKFRNYEATLLIGLWQSDTKNIGGPMQAYAFYVPEQDRYYVIYFNIFAPDRRKEPYIRELRTIVETFKAFAIKESRTS